MQTTWIVQENLNPTAGRSTLGILAQEVEVAGRNLVRLKVIPFAEELPELPDIPLPFVFYGYSTLITNVWRSPRWRSGVFFDPALFTPAQYAQHYGERYLNADAEILTFSELNARDYDPTGRLFLRPNDDLKKWTGSVMTFGEFQVWFAGFAGDLELPVNANSALQCAPPQEIAAEYRIFLVDGKAVAQSQYRPDACAWVPPEVAAFAEECAAIWLPSPVTVMDIARVESGLKLIELNCFNGCGFYLADVRSIVRNVSAYLEAAL